MLERPGRIGAEDLEIDGGAEAELSTGDRRCTAVTAVADGRDAGGETLRGSELRDVDVRSPVDPRLALDVERDPFREVTEPVAEAPVHGVLEMRVRVHEPGHDDGVVVARAFAEIIGLTDGGDASALDHDGAGLDRRALDGKNPIGGENSSHGSVTLLTGSGRGARRSISTASQIDPSHHTINGNAFHVVVTRSITGSSTAMEAAMK